MIRRQPIFVVMTLLWLATWSWAADDKESAPTPPVSSDQVFADIAARTNGEPVLLTQAERYSQWDGRFGYWAMWHGGSVEKVGEWQDLGSSPFLDLDGFTSNGTRTLAFTATSSGEETNQGNLYYYQNGVTARIDYESFPHNLDHDPLNNIANPADTLTPAKPGFTSPDPKIIKDDLNVGKNYALRVQEVNASIKGIVCDDNVKVRLDVWGMRKDGTRQVNAVAKCFSQTGATPGNPLGVPPDHPPVQTFSGSKCHVLSQAQNIDWTTTEIKPVIEAHLGDRITLEYSRPMRNFTSDDDGAFRFYNGTGQLSYPGTNGGNPYPYAVVPNNYTDMDQLKISGDLSDDNKFYAFMMAGRTVDRGEPNAEPFSTNVFAPHIDMTRWFNDMDFRITNTSIEKLTATAYGTVYNDSEDRPPFSDLPPEDVRLRASRKLQLPVDYHKSTLGLRGVWRPGCRGYALGGLAVAGGYEYCDLDRANAIFFSPTGATPATARAEVDESRTITNSFQVGPDYRWSCTFDTYLHYKYQHAANPLLGFKQDNGVFNTMLPEDDHIVELGLNWFPAEWLMFNACVGIENSSNHSQPAVKAVDPTLSSVNFDEQNYPMTFSMWYAASDCWSFSAGYAIYSNFVAQDIVIGDDSAPYSSTHIKPVTSPWTYGAQAHVVTLGSRYLATQRVTLTGDFEWVRGHDSITNSATTFPAPGSGATITDLGGYSEILNETTRISMGVDWMIRPRVVLYTRYELYNFEDMRAAPPPNQTGWAQGILGGFSAIF